MMLTPLEERSFQLRSDATALVASYFTVMLALIVPLIDDVDSVPVIKAPLMFRDDSGVVVRLLLICPPMYTTPLSVALLDGLRISRLPVTTSAGRPVLGVMRMFLPASWRSPLTIRVPSKVA